MEICHKNNLREMSHAASVASDMNNIVARGASARKRVAPTASLQIVSFVIRNRKANHFQYRRIKRQVETEIRKQVPNMGRKGGVGQRKKI